MTEQEALKCVLKNGSRTCLYEDDYKALVRDLGAAYLDLRNYCRSQGSKDIRQWLKSKGLFRDVYRDMRESVSTIDYDVSEAAICSQILEIFPLAGEPILPADVVNRIMTKAQTIFDRILEDEEDSLADEEQEILTIAIIQLLKQRDVLQDNQADQHFWPYIYSQFGFKKENDKSNDNRITQHLYNVLRTAVRTSFLRHQRFFSSEKETQQYYTSLRLHSLTPTQSMESLFEILLFFYMNDLDFTYIPEDPAFTAVVNCIAWRWDKDIEQQEGLSVRSNAMASGLKALFRERPSFMRNYCEKIVRQIDALVRGTDVINPESTLDCLLSCWYGKKDDQLRNALSKDVRNMTGALRISSSSAVRLRYMMDNRRVYISVPPIRLENKKESYPVFELYQGSEVIWSHEMEVYGRLSWTTRAFQTDLERTSLDYDKPLNISAKIVYGTEVLFESNEKLFRHYLIFDEYGHEISSNTRTEGVFFLFANTVATINTGSIEPEWIDSSGQFLRIYVDTSSAVYIDGEELFLSKENKNDIRFYPSIDRIHGLRGRYCGETFTLYSSSFILDYRLPEGKRSLNYRIIIDDAIEPLSKFCPGFKSAFSLNAPDAPLRKHEIQIMEFATGRCVSKFVYSILPDAKCKIDDEIIYDDGTPACLRVSFAGTETVVRDYPLEDIDWITVPADQLSFDLEARLPIVRGTLQDKRLFALPSIIWHGEIPDFAFVRIKCPKGWSCNLYLGKNSVPQNTSDGSYELGNYIRSYNPVDKESALSLILKDTDGNQEERIITKIGFKEYFTETPVSLENGVLLWRPTGKYIGGRDDKFQLIINVPGEEFPFEYSTNLEDQTIDRLFAKDYPCGEFPYRITKKQNSIFAKRDIVLLENTLTIGEPEQRQVYGKCFYLTRARCWDMNINRMVVLTMPEGAGCLCDLQFQGYSIPAGEEIEYPEYTAELYFFNSATNKWQRFNDQDRKGYECINPVHVWLISDHMMILLAVDEGGVMIDRDYNSIVNHSLGVSGIDVKYRIIFPDYFEYYIE